MLLLSHVCSLTPEKLIKASEQLFKCIKPIGFTSDILDLIAIHCLYLYNLILHHQQFCFLTSLPDAPLSSPSLFRETQWSLQA